MRRAHQLLFAGMLVVSCWYAMLMTHEFGHVLGAVVTGGSVQRVILHPLAISRTDVQPNPHPAAVVWLGPILGCALPLCLFVGIPTRAIVLRNVVGFFAGFCLLANGAYIGVGAWDAVGDCREMLQAGTPLWAMVLFGIAAVSSGLLVWHRLGSLRDFFGDTSILHGRWTWSLGVVLTLYLVGASLLSLRA